MIWAALFFLGFCVVAAIGVAAFARRGSGERITGPTDREIDYDNPYGRGTYFWTNRRSR